MRSLRLSIGVIFGEIKNFSLVLFEEAALTNKNDIFIQTQIESPCRVGKKFVGLINF